MTNRWIRKITTLTLCLVAMGALGACETTSGSYAADHRSFGEALRPFSRVGPAQTNQAIRRFESQGRLLDMLGSLR